MSVEKVCARRGGCFSFPLFHAFRISNPIPGSGRMHRKGASTPRSKVFSTCSLVSCRNQEARKIPQGALRLFSKERGGKNSIFQSKSRRRPEALVFSLSLLVDLISFLSLSTTNSPGPTSFSLTRMLNRSAISVGCVRCNRGEEE